MTHLQMKRLDHLCAILDCDRDDFSVTHDPPDLPSGWISATVGERKGRPKSFDIDPKGIPHA